MKNEKITQLRVCVKLEDNLTIFKHDFIIHIFIYIIKEINYGVVKMALFIFVHPFINGIVYLFLISLSLPLIPFFFSFLSFLILNLF